MYGKDHVVDLPVHELDDELMLKILANENVETEEDRTAYQIDTVIAVRDYLKQHLPTVQPTDSRDSGGKFQKGVSGNPDAGIGARQISAFLGSQNWSKTRVADLLKLDAKLSPEIVSQLT